MNRLIPVAALVACVFSAPAFAADAKVEAALKAFAAVEADAGKIKVYCQMSRAMMRSADEKESGSTEALDKEIEAQMNALGADFQQAWDLGAESDPDSEDGKALTAAIEKLEAKCDK